MRDSFDFEQIKTRYKFYYEQAIQKKTDRLPFYEIQRWDKVLNKVASRIFEDIRVIGMPLYPIYPYTEHEYLHFANPFEKVGIEIIYKESPQDLINRKMLLLKSLGWTMYTIKSQDTYYTMEDFFSIKRKNKELNFSELDDEMQLIFFEKYHKENASCLLYHMQAVHFYKDSMPDYYIN